MPEIDFKNTLMWRGYPPLVAQRANHRLRSAFALAGDLRVRFDDGEVYVLRAFSEVDFSIDGKRGQWSATVVDPVESRGHFKAGSGIDFLEDDVVEIQDPLGGVVYLRRGL